MVVAGTIGLPQLIVLFMALLLVWSLYRRNGSR